MTKLLELKEYRFVSVTLDKHTESKMLEITDCSDIHINTARRIYVDQKTTVVNA